MRRRWEIGAIEVQYVRLKFIGYWLQEANCAYYCVNIAHATFYEEVNRCRMQDAGCSNESKLGIIC